MSVKDERQGWPGRRRVWVDFMFAGPFSTAFINEKQSHRDATIEFKTMVLEKLCHACADGSKWGLSDAGRVLRVLYMLGDKEAGPWTLTQIRQFADMKRLTADEVAAGLEVLVEFRIVDRQPSSRTIKWDLK
ncbi:hypothetical protein CcrC1_gp291 [Caulobacter phage C1]|nr:hypothetical protein CcrC1_gp291 [Caulobacter phage C1]UTU08520.1 hypothetical protein CcrC2_gp292 [Caulobacter phage C2]UTU09036.1 hypothetical protein CcrJ4_gp287 [Caulobacter phage J4]UTU09596.1 hypothetical protein CcrBL47_gp310 [Caulobacter phage BL47]UTU10153.1 hypothetical protein CcrRB23_gp291 [Caulobacter phage RB23]WGN97187.1 hypothetical protein [Bertelyvirus sp.]